MKTLKETLDERGSVYGSFDAGTDLLASILNSLTLHRHNTTGSFMTTTEQVMFQYILMKLVRLAASPDHIDSWHDIQGYAKLIEEYYQEKKNA